MKRQFLLLLDAASHLHGLAFFNVTGNQQRQNYFQNLLKPNKIENAHFINKIVFNKIIKFFICAFKINSHGL